MKFIHENKINLFKLWIYLVFSCKQYNICYYIHTGAMVCNPDKRCSEWTQEIEIFLHW